MVNSGPIDERDTQVLLIDGDGGNGDSDSDEIGTTRGGSDGSAALSTRTKVRALFPLLKYMVPLAVVYYAEYVINTGVNSTLHFSSMDSKAFYTWAGFVYQVGVFISRSSGTVFPIRLLWPLPVGQALLLVAFVLQGIYRVIPSPWVVLCFVVVVGLFGGACYVNAFRQISEDMKDPRLREFSLGVASVADTLGIVLASITAIFLECELDKYHGFPHHDVC